MANEPSGRISGADGVRALAALMVIFHHLFQKLAAGSQSAWLQDAHGMIIKGASGVSIFFVLSGMLLSFPFWRAYFQKRPHPSIRHYVARRAARIMPGFYVALAVSFWVTAATARSHGAQITQPLRRLIAGATFTSEFHWVTFFPDDSNGPLWSIGFEVFCYVLLPLFMLGLFALKRRGRRIAWGYWAGVFALILILNQWVISTFVPGDDGRGWQFGVVGGAKLWMPDYNPVGFFGHFAMGIFAAGFIAAWKVFHGGRRSWWFDAVAAAAFAGILALFWFKRFPAEMDNTLSLQHQPYFFPLLAGLVAILLCGLAYSVVLGRAFDNPFMRYTAKISFGLYIWHFLIVLWVGRALEPDFLNYGGVEDPWRLLEIGSFVLIVSYAVATLSWHLIERPFLEGRFSGRRNAGLTSRARLASTARPTTKEGSA
jgi:peptidoglycan/LPS O-acetylase OafA/YrhL